MAKPTVALDVPSIPQTGVDPKLYWALTRVVEELRRLMGLGGDPLDQAVTYRAFGQAGYVDPTTSPRRGGSPWNIAPPGGTTIINNGAGGSTDPTPPPAVLSLVATATFSNVIVQWAAPTFTQGGGARAVRVFAAKRLTTDPPATFIDAVQVEEAQHPLNIIAIPAEPNIRWHIWAKFVTNAGIESPTPSGGTNGVQVVVGKIDGAQHIELLTITSALIANLAVDDAKIANLSVAKLLAGSLAVGQHIQSSNYPSSGFRLDADGTLNLRSANAGARMMITNDSIQVFDSSGVRRVQFGNLAP